MDAKTRKMVLEIVAERGGDAERAARYISRTLRIGRMAECRALVAEATVEVSQAQIDAVVAERDGWIRDAIAYLPAAAVYERETLLAIYHAEGFPGREDKVGCKAEARVLAAERLEWLRAR